MLEIGSWQGSIFKHFYYRTVKLENNLTISESWLSILPQLWSAPNIFKPFFVLKLIFLCTYSQI